jgi:transposase
MTNTLKKRNRETYRNKLIVAWRKAGYTYREISEEFGISICRVRQIIEVWEDRDE